MKEQSEERCIYNANILIYKLSVWPDVILALLPFPPSDPHNLGAMRFHKAIRIMWEKKPWIPVRYHNVGDVPMARFEVVGSSSHVSCE